MDQAASGLPRHQLGVRLLLGALTVGALVLVAGLRPGQGGDDVPQALQYRVRCAENGDGGMTCFLTVSGLPSPLDDKVSVALFTVDGPGEPPEDQTPTDTVVASEAPDMAPAAPALVTRQLPFAPPSPAPVSAQVPEPPPKSL